MKGVLARARFHFRLDATLVFRVLKALSDTGNEQKRERRNVVFQKESCLKHLRTIVLLIIFTHGTSAKAKPDLETDNIIWRRRTPMELGFLRSLRGCEPRMGDLIL